MNLKIYVCTYTHTHLIPMCNVTHRHYRTKLLNNTMHTHTHTHSHTHTHTRTSMHSKPYGPAPCSSGVGLLFIINMKVLEFVERCDERCDRAKHKQRGSAQALIELRIGAVDHLEHAAPAVGIWCVCVCVCVCCVCCVLCVVSGVR